jgi:hypothetical protein
MIDIQEQTKLQLTNLQASALKHLADEGGSS